MARKTSYPWHVLLVAVYPAFSLFAHNIGEILYRHVWRALLVNLLCAIVLLWLLHFLLQQWGKAGIVLSLGIGLFNTYGYTYDRVSGLELAGFTWGRHAFLLPLWLLVFAGAAWWIIRQKRDFLLTTSVLNGMAAALMLIPVYQLLVFEHALVKYRDMEVFPSFAVDVSNVSSPAEAQPDVYFIVLDMYGRSDVLREKYGYDNSDFLEALEAMGFYISSCSQSNYPGTSYSLAATLNMGYIDEQAFPAGDSTTIRLLHREIQDSEVASIFEQLGYKTVAFETGYAWTEIISADYYLASATPELNYYEQLLVKNSLLRVLLRALEGTHWADKIFLSADRGKRDMTLFVLDQLEQSYRIAGPKFVFAHIVVPHPPFVFGPGGELSVTSPEYFDGVWDYSKKDFLTGYRKQLQFIDGRMLDVLSKILASSDMPPVIILQGDHGPSYGGDVGRFSILNAYNFPDVQLESNQALSPVNNFRLVFRSYYGLPLSLLPDDSYRPGQPGKIVNDCDAPAR